MRVVARVTGNPWWLAPLAAFRPEPDLSPEEKFLRLRNAALATPYFSRHGRAQDLRAATSLSQLPVLPLREVLDCRSQFINPNMSAGVGRLRIPFPTVCGALIGRKLRLPENFTFIENGSLGRLHLSPTRMLAATPAALRRICAAVHSRFLALPQLCEAVIVLQGIEEGTLFSGERDMLWNTLGVPVFEQWLGLDGELIAWECGMHQGLHFQCDRAELEQIEGELVLTSWYGLCSPAPRLATGWTAEFDPRACRCGNSSPLLLDFTIQEPAPTPKVTFACA
ncbi:MAG: hypothetical protein ACK5TN_05325 [Acidobacteriota bacterium]|jgi:hypothetical protein